MVADGKIYTPQSGSSTLIGITRDTVITIARDLGYEIIESTIPREMLYTVDEVFFTGTAAEITPVATVDRIKVGNGGKGEITDKIQKAFFEVVEGKNPKYNSWLTYIR
jgi:branched-chain amino acid aminotransferase